MKLDRVNQRQIMKQTASMALTSNLDLLRRGLQSQSSWRDAGILVLVCRT